MIVTSSAFDERIKKFSRTFRARFLKGGTPLECDVRKVNIQQGACGDTFSPGTVYSPYITAEISNCSEIIENEELLLQIGLLLDDGTVEYINKGYYTVTKPKKNVNQTTFEAVGRISSKLNILPDIPEEQTIGNLANAITEKSGVTILFKNVDSSGVILNNLDGLTGKELLKIMTAVLGGFATEDGEGNIVVSKFSTENAIEYNGDYTITPPEVKEYDYILDGIKIIVSSEQTDENGGSIAEVSYVEGSPKMTLSNEFMTGELFECLKTNLIGYSFRAGTINLALGDPRIEPWDCISYTDPEGDVYIVPCHEIEHTFDGGFSTTILAGAPSDSDNNSLKGPIQNAIERINAELFTAKDAIVKRITAEEADIKYAKLTEFTSLKGYVENLSAKSITTENISAEVAKLGYATIIQLNATSAEINSLKAKAITTDNVSAEVAKLGYATIGNLNAVDAKFDNLSSNYATIDLANVKDGAITTAMIGTGVVGSAQIADGSITDAKIVDLTANKITAGTLSVERLVIRGTTSSLVYALNNVTGALQSQNVNTLNGEILTNRTITADKIVANAITANEIASKTITANELAAGSVTAEKISVSSLQAISANIGGFSIGNSYLANNTTKLAGTDSSVYLGLDGISCGKGFKVNSQGSLTATSGEISIFKFNEYGFTAQFIDDEVVRGYSFRKDYYRAEIFDDTNTSCGYFYLDTMDGGRTIIEGKKVELRTSGLVKLIDSNKMYSRFTVDMRNDVVETELSINSSKTITAEEDVVAGNISLKNHTHNYAGSSSAGGAAYSALTANTLTDLTASITELNYVKGVTSSIQTQLNGKADTHSHPYLSNSLHCIELNLTGSLANYGGFIDFHYNGSSSDYTSRIIENASGTLSVNGVTITSGKIVTAKTFVGELSGNAATASTLLNLTASIGELNYLAGVTSSIQTQLNGKASTSHKHSASDITTSGYLNIHPENTTFTLIPFIHNDIAFIDKKGGSYSCYSTTATDFTVASLAQTALTVSNAANMFDGSPSYATLPTTSTYTAVIDVVLHKKFSYSTQFYIDFGSASWRAKTVAVYVMNDETETAYVKKGDVSNLGTGNWFLKFSHTSTNASGSTVQGFNRLRVVLKDFNGTSGRRIAQIGLVNYGSAGVTETFISRGGCSGIYGSLIPHTTNNVDLGSSSKKWRNIYATTFTGNLSGNASSATKATQDSNGNVITSTYLPLTGGNISGHIYLTGSQASSSTGNTSQIIFGTASNNHVAISSNNNALVINPTSSSTTNQIVLYLDKASLFPGGIQANVTGNLSGNASSATKATQDSNGNVIATTYLPLTGGTLEGVLNGPKLKATGVIASGGKGSYNDGAPGCVLGSTGRLYLSGDSNNAPGISMYTNGATSAGASISYTSDDSLNFRYATKYIYDATIYTDGGLVIGSSDTAETMTGRLIRTYWADGQLHDLINRNSDGLNSGIGWAGTSTYATVTTIRGRTCRYTNSSGTTTLSDERLKKDFTELTGWENFYDSVKPWAFKMKSGNSGRWHIGFKAQEVEKNLLSNGMSSKDFAGFIRMKYTPDEDDPEGNLIYKEAGIMPGEDELGLIYTEFIALNKFKIDKHTAHIKHLEEEINILNTDLAQKNAIILQQNSLLQQVLKEVAELKEKISILAAA